MKIPVTDPLEEPFTTIDASSSALLPEPTTPELIAVTSATPTLMDQDEVLDWDVYLEVPPSRPGGTISVRLKYAGRAQPTPVDDPRVV